MFNNSHASCHTVTTFYNFHYIYGYISAKKMKKYSNIRSINKINCLKITEIQF